MLQGEVVVLPLYYQAIHELVALHGANAHRISNNSYEIKYIYFYRYKLIRVHKLPNIPRYGQYTYKKGFVVQKKKKDLYEAIRRK